MEVTKEEFDLLTKISQVEASMDEDHRALGWSWMDVSIYSATIHKLLVKGLVKCTYKSRSTTNYMLTDTAKNVLAGVHVNSTAEEKAIPQVDFAEMFSDIVGYDDIKELLRESLQLDKPIHVLLFGPPSLAKSMFLWDVERAFGPQTLPLIGSATSHAGMWDLIAERQPKIILIDELEKMGLQDTAGLLSLMERGRIIRTKVGRKIDVQLTCWVIGTANRIGKLPAELLSRFAKFQLSEYNSTEYTKVVESVLVRHEDLQQDDAHEVAIRLVGMTHDVRDAVRVARLSKRVGVKRAVELLIGSS
jgi:Holliday junction DNA helicase RuvB